MMTAGTAEAEREQWIANLDTVAAVEPSIVAAGCKTVHNHDDPKIITECRRYLAWRCNHHAYY
jgi:hypothetical protein